MKTFHHLYFLQDEILSALSEFAKKNDFPFVLTGGTALVRFLLKSSYRVSYDLDFFSVRNISDKEVQEVISFLSQRFDVRFNVLNRYLISSLMTFVKCGDKTFQRRLTLTT